MANSQNFSTQKSVDSRSKSCETVCSSNSSCFLQKRKPIHPLAGFVRSNLTRNSSNNTIRQRVLSAKLLKLKSVQNQLNDANFHLAEVIRENKALKTLQVRQDKALSKYEGTNAELPKLLQSHEEEIRTLKEKNKILKRNVKELNEQLKNKEDELNSVLEQLKHLNRLNKDKHLMEREKLSEQVEDLKNKLQKADDQINLQNRRLTLESKTCKHKLNSEIIKHKMCQKELAQALSEISKLTGLLQSKDKLGISPRKQYTNITNKESISLISLNEKKMPVTEIKLKPILNKKEDRQFTNGILSSPSENIKARLSADLLQKSKENELLLLDMNNINLSDSSDTSGDNNRKYSDINFFISSRPNSSQKLEKINHKSTTTKKVEEKEEENNSKDFTKHLENYCSYHHITNTAKNCTDVIETHKENLHIVKSDTEKLLDSLKKTENMEMNLLSFDSSDLTINDNIDFVNQILNEELSFKNTKIFDTNTNKIINNIKKRRDPPVALNDKKKLLETLRAIDNGDNVDTFENNSHTTSELINEIFGDTTDC